MDSMVLFIRHLVHWHENAPSYMQKKLPKGELEKMAERAAVIHQCGQELLKSIPNSTEKQIEDYLYTPYTRGASGIEVEFSAAILEKSDAFNLRDVSAVKELINSVVGGDTDASKQVDNQLAMATEIEVDTFNLCMKQIGHDVERLRAWQTKNKSFESAIFFKKSDWVTTRNEEIRNEAKKLLQSVSTLFVVGTEAEAIHAIVQFKRSICDRLGGAMDGVVNLMYLNWCSPCSITSSHQTVQARMLSWGMANNEKSAGVLLMPIFSHKKKPALDCGEGGARADPQRQPRRRRHSHPELQEPCR